MVAFWIQLAVGLLCALAGAIAQVKGSVHIAIGLWVWCAFVLAGTFHSYAKHKVWSKTIRRWGTAIVGLVFLAPLPFVYEWLNVPEKSPFGVDIGPVLVADSADTAMFVATYPSIFGDTMSPLLYLAHLQITNLQDMPTTIREVKLAVSMNGKSSWESLKHIPIGHMTLFSLVSGKPQPKAIGFSSGTYRLSSAVPKDDMKHAAALIAQPLLDIELRAPINPHATVGGWIALDSPSHRGAGPGGFYWKIELRDNAGKTGSFILPTPIKRDTDPSSVDLHSGEFIVTGATSDISAFKFHYYSNPFKKPN